MNANLIIGKKFPKVEYAYPWESAHFETNGKVIYAKGKYVFDNNRCVDMLVKRLNSGARRVERHFSEALGGHDIISLFDKDGNFIHCKVLKDGKLIEFSRNTIKKIRDYQVNKKGIIRLIKQIITKK